MDDIAPRKTFEDEKTTGHELVFEGKTVVVEAEDDINNNKTCYENLKKNRLDVKNEDYQVEEKNPTLEIKKVGEKNVSMLTSNSDADHSVRIITREERHKRRRNLGKEENFQLAATPQRKRFSQRLSVSDCESIKEEDDEDQPIFNINKREEVGSNEGIVKVQTDGNNKHQDRLKKFTLPNPIETEQEKEPMQVAVKKRTAPPKKETAEVILKKGEVGKHKDLTAEKLNIEKTNSLKSENNKKDNFGGACRKSFSELLGRSFNKSKFFQELEKPKVNYVKDAESTPSKGGNIKHKIALFQK